MTPEGNCGGHCIDSRGELWAVSWRSASLKEWESGGHFEVSAKEPIPPLSPPTAQCNGPCLKDVPGALSESALRLLCCQSKRQSGPCLMSGRESRPLEVFLRVQVSPRHCEQLSPPLSQ